MSFFHYVLYISNNFKFKKAINDVFIFDYNFNQRISIINFAYLIPCFLGHPVYSPIPLDSFCFYLSSNNTFLLVRRYFSYGWPARITRQFLLQVFKLKIRTSYIILVPGQNLLEQKSVQNIDLGKIKHFFSCSELKTLCEYPLWKLLISA